MPEIIVTTAKEPRAFLVGAEVRGSRPLLSLDDSLAELLLLARTAGLEVLGQTKQHMQQIDPHTFVGSGKVEEIRETLENLGAQVVIFDDELSPRHQRELEKQFGDDVRVLDRSALILDIFAQHAHTREGALQVELAQYEYRLPRLTRQWTHLARQAGGGAARGGASGVGLRGPGETQLEVDRREIGRKITRLKQDLDSVREQRRQHRQQRARVGTPIISLVGYTNAGKSTLLRTLSGADVYVADQLFATLDPLTRRVLLPSGRTVLVTDTVGFIQKLPTTLIASFRATLEEISESDLILHVVDSSHPNVLEQIETVDDTLAEIEVPAIPRLLIWNKADLVSEASTAPSFRSREYVDEVSISAVTGFGVDRLLQTIERTLTANYSTKTLLIPYEHGELVSYLFDTAHVESQEHTPKGIRIRATMPPSVFQRMKRYQVGK